MISIANLSKELVTEKILFYNLPSIDTSHTQMLVRSNHPKWYWINNNYDFKQNWRRTIKQLLPLILVLHKLLGKTFTIQIKKLFAKNKDASSTKLFIMSITEKDIASNLPLPLTAPTTPESNKHKLKQIMTKED
ncbi:hypothetical protein H5410_020877 [Solanum commersonii]|uniref:Uncharacterized protein n=1 Tax=Solanum commersonii TaxID=4109 RepID=A0A9J5ZDJ5_SOLCO|nr:hypothetical protein H5410_020877 [Solanum commersonii]